MICVKKRHIHITYYSNEKLRSADHSSNLSFKVQAQLRPILTEAQLKDEEFWAALIEAQDFGPMLFHYFTYNKMS